MAWWRREPQSSVRKFLLEPSQMWRSVSTDRRPGNAMVGTPLIKGSVGFGGQNNREDVNLVQRALNEVPLAQGGPSAPLGVDGLVGPKTIGAVRAFQQRNTGMADGRIDPGFGTEKAIAQILQAIGKLQQILQGKGGGPVPPTPLVKGPNSPIRLRFKSILQGLLPPPGTLTQGKKPAVGTACGELPGRVFLRVPVIPPNQPGAFKINLPGAGIVFLTTPMTQWEGFAQGVDRQHGARTWIQLGGQKPLPGDIYVLGKFENKAAFQHVGIILDSSGTDWMTADAGQGNGGQSGFMKRTFNPATGQIDGEFGNQAFLRGWADFDLLTAVAISAFPKNL
jgi:hypothetical protein